MASLWERIKGKRKGGDSDTDSPDVAAESTSSRPGRPRPHQPPLLINLGVDFGTSFTKVCYRDAARGVSGIVDFTDEKSTDIESGFVSSKIALDRRVGELIAGVPVAEWDERVTSEHRQIRYSKVRLALLDRIEEIHGFELPPIPGFESGEDVEALVAAFLANVLTRSRHWILKNRADDVRGRNIVWSANVGVPVKIYDSPAIDRFRRVLAIASRMSDGEDASIESIKRARELYAATKDIDELVDVHAVPEIAAAVQSFLISPTAEEGLYLYFDIGGATLDGVSFRYERVRGRPNVDFYGAEIAALGIEAIASRHETQGFNSVREALFAIQPDASLIEELGSERHQIGTLVAKVVLAAKNKDGRNWVRDAQFSTGHLLANLGIPNNDRRPMLVFLGGGGQPSPFYRHVIENTQSERFSNINVPKFMISSVPTPDDLQMGNVPVEQFHRFAIAYGLSVPEGQGTEIRLPSDIAEELPTHRPRTPVGVYDD